MNRIVDQLQSGFENILSGKLSIGAEAVNSSESELSPWAAWLLICLLRYRSKLRWLWKVANSIALELQVDGGNLPLIQLTSGLVPGRTDWEYCFHGVGCRLTNRITGEVIEADYPTRSSTQIDVHFFIDHLRSIRSPEWPESRLISLHPSFTSIDLSFDELADFQLLEGTRNASFSEDGGPRRRNLALRYRLSRKCRALGHLIGNLSEQFADDGCRRSFAAVLRDWEYVATDCEVDVRRIVSRRWEECRQAKHSRLRRLLSDKDRALYALQSLAELNTPDLDQLLRDALHGVPSAATLVALEIVSKMKEPIWLSEVYELFALLKPSNHPPEPAIWEQCAGMLLKADYRSDEVVSALQNAAPSSVAEAAILALEFRPSICLELFRKALRSSIPNARCVAAAVLAILDESWTRNELVAAMNESSDRETTLQCRAALRESRSHDVRAVVDDWEQRNPGEEPLWCPDSSEWIRLEMESLHDRVLPLRERPVLGL